MKWIIRIGGISIIGIIRTIRISVSFIYALLHFRPKYIANGEVRETADPAVGAFG